MNEVKRPRKPLIYYYVIVMTIVVLFNLLAMPALMEMQVKEVDYGTFMAMTAEGNLGRVQIETNQITFTDKEETQIYKTGRLEDSNLTERLYAAGITNFGAEIVEETSPLLSMMLTWVLPMGIFIFIGQMASKKMMDKMGGPNAMSFNMGKSNAKVYVKSSDGISFADVEGVDEAEESLAEIVDYLRGSIFVMHRVLKKDEILTIPNLLSVVRLLLIPLIVWLYCARQEYHAAVVVVVLSGITDIADGIIARKFHMVSDFGKILDPIADKLTQAALIACLIVKFDWMLPLLILLVV